MSSSDSSPAKRGIRRFLRQKWGSYTKGPSSISPSAPKRLEAAAVASPRSPLPNQTGSTQSSVSKSPSDRLGQSTQDPLHGPYSPVTISPSNLVKNPSDLIGSKPYKSKDATSTVWTGLGAALRALEESAGLFPPLYSAIETFAPCLGILEEVAKYRKEYEDLASELISLSEFMTRHMNESTSAQMSNSIAEAANSINQQAAFIINKANRGIGTRLLEAGADEEEVMRCYRQIQNVFRKLQMDVAMNAARVAEEQQMDARLATLNPARLAIYNSKLSTEINRRTCTENTRKGVLSNLHDWSLDLDAADVYWMNGMAGTGKTTIACSFSKELEDRKMLAASFFCTRTSPECRDVNRIIPTIAYQLARHLPSFRSAICDIIGTDPDISSKTIPKQFEQLLRIPLLRVGQEIQGSLVVTIDALDECEDRNGTGIVIETLFRFAADLPLKFFVTSRPEPDIYDRLKSGGHSSRSVLHLHDIERSLVQADIKVYLAEELAWISPTTTQIQTLAQRSGSLFIFAATLVRYIHPVKRSIDPQKRLQSVLAMTSYPKKAHTEIHDLYLAILKAALDDDGLEDDEVETMYRVLWTAVCAEEPVEIGTLAALAALDSVQQALPALEALRSVVHFSESSGLVSTLHASFPDFMFNKEWSGPYFCDANRHSHLLTQSCFNTMKSQLRFNVCNLGSSFVFDEEVDGLDERVGKAISPALSYACRYWGNHLQASPYSSALFNLLQEFLSVRLLFWMEVLNLKGIMGTGQDTLFKAKQWLDADPDATEIAKLAEDARDFVTSFAANPVCRSTPHIYVSSLPFCPKSSAVFKTYWNNVRGTINLSGNAMHTREMAPLATWKTSSGVTSVTYSPEGTSIAFGCRDGTISVRNARDGALNSGMIDTQTRPVTSVTFSPDGVRIISGSGSKESIVQAWSAPNGILVARLLEDSQHLITSVIAHSPDGTRIASGSHDFAIRIWDTNTNRLATKPLEGHSNRITAVAFSPNADFIASGSDDRTIRIWNARNGARMASNERLIYHLVTSLVYSPDGTTIVSGAADGTIRIWDAQDCRQIDSLFEGHTGLVASVAYSPDGTHVISGSYDCAIRVWKALDGTLVAGPFGAHTASIASVAYSPDGTRIVSGSEDGTLRLWNPHVNNALTAPIEGNTSSIAAVVYSPDGSQIVSSSYDHTIQTWDAQDATRVAYSAEDLSDSATLVAFLPSGARHVPSHDQVLRVWNEHDTVLIASPSKDEIHLATSVAYSPDGTRIASGSYDCAIHVWDVRRAAIVVGPFKGHTALVASLSYSRDGTRIVSGSYDSTVRIWNVNDATPLAGPFRGHFGPVTAVSYSPDGSHVVSGSNDNTIRIWRVADGTLVTNAFNGHTDSIKSVAYSPDGMRIVSSSYDGTIRVWQVPQEAHSSDSLNHNLAANPLTTLGKQHRYILSHWQQYDDGWLANNNTSNYLFWVPPDMVNLLPYPNNVFVIGPFGTLHVDYSDLCIGENWHKCYVSEVPTSG